MNNFISQSLKEIAITNKFFFFFFYILILISFAIKLPPIVILGGMISLMSIHVFLFPSDFLYFPFIIYPFRFLIRVSDIDSIFLSLLPEAITIISLIFFLVNISLPRNIIKVSKTIFYLVTFITLSTLILFIHGIYYESMYFLAVLRTYILPFAFTLAVINFSRLNNFFPNSALTLYMISTSIIALICLLQYFNFYHLPNNDLMFYRTHIAGGFDDRALYESERSIGTFILPRLNLLSGGSLGSSAGFFFAIGILWQTSLFKTRKLLRILLSCMCILSSLLTLSFSILNTLLIFGLIYFLVGNKGKYSLFSSVFSKILLFLLFLPLFFLIKIGDMTLNEYIILTYFSSSESNLSLSTILVGFGIDYFSVNYNIIPENNIGDIGVYKIFFQTGIFSFTFLFFTFYYLIREALYKISLGYSQIKYTYLYIILLILVFVHQNWMIGSPFYLLFSASVAGIYSCDLEKKQISTFKR